MPDLSTGYLPPFPELSLDAGALAVEHAGDAAAAASADAAPAYTSSSASVGGGGGGLIIPAECRWRGRVRTFDTAGPGDVTACPAARRSGGKELSLIPSPEPARTQASASAPTLEERVSEWAAKKAAAGVPAHHCVLPFLTGAPRAVECCLCSKIIYAGEEIKCSVKKCPQMFHLNCVKDTSNFTAENFRCPQHACMVCKQKMFFWRCGRCTVAAHTKCAPWPEVHLKDNQGSAICWRHTSDWLLQNENAKFTNSIEEVFCRLPLPYVNEDLDIESTIRDYAEAVYKPPPYTSIRRNVYLIKKKRTGVRVDIGCTNCRADSTCKEDCECRGLSMSCSKNCRCSDLCTNRPFRKDKKIRIVKTQFGWDAFALEPLQKGDFIIEYVGEVIDDETCEKRLWDIRQHGDKTVYMCQISKDFTIDATFKGNISRFLNHGYEPNCKLEKWLVDGETRVGIFASQSIEVGEPLTYDCRFVHFGGKVKCHCEALNFQGYLGNQIKNPAQNALATATQGKLREYCPAEQGSSAPRLKSVTCLLPWTNCTEVSFNLRSKRNINQLCWADKRKRTSLMASPASMQTSEVSCRPPAPYANEEFTINPTIKEFPGAVYKPPPYTPISCNVSVNNMKHGGVPAKAVCTNCSVASSCNDESLCRPVRRYKKKSFPLFHPLDRISEAIARIPDNANIGDKAQHVANVGEEQNSTDSSRGMVDSGKLGLDHELPQDLDGSLGVSADDVDKQAQRSDEHVTEKPLTRSKRGISKKHKDIAAMLCIEETGSAHPDSGSAQASVNEQESNQGKNYSISRC